MQGGILNKRFVVIVCAFAAVAVAAPARVIYVDVGAAGAKTGASWADACNYLQDALALAAAAEKPAAGQLDSHTARTDRPAHRCR